MESLYGLFGEKLSHSLSPLIHSIFFNKMNMEAYYHLFELKREDLGDAVKGLKAIGAKGINVTIPYKVDIIKELDEISEEARRLGAVNTICFDNGKTIGYNSDYYGFGKMLQKNDIKIKGKKAVILGSGGSSRTVFQYLVDSGIEEITIVIRDLNKQRTKEEMWKVDWIYKLKEETDNEVIKNSNLISYEELNNLTRADILVNTTPSGMYPKLINQSPVDKKVVSKFSSVVDLIFNPRETLLLSYARECNIKSVNGLYMLVAQAMVSQEFWNKLKIEDDVVDQIYEEVIIKTYGEDKA